MRNFFDCHAVKGKLASAPSRDATLVRMHGAAFGSFGVSGHHPVTPIADERLPGTSDGSKAGAMHLTYISDIGIMVGLAWQAEPAYQEEDL
jgi:hypothetical protein